jgi:uncharacterized membrane protein (UPF0127 family)
MKQLLTLCRQLALPLLIISSVIAVILHKESPISPATLTGTLPEATRMRFEIASTPAAREKGLQGHAPLKDNEGMMLVFEQPQIVCLWNKGVPFPIDVAVLDNEQHILGHTSMEANSEKKVCSPVETKYVLEAKLGTFDKYKE